MLSNKADRTLTHIALWMLNCFLQARHLCISIAFILLHQLHKVYSYFLSQTGPSTDSHLSWMTSSHWCCKCSRLSWKQEMKSPITNQTTNEFPTVFSWNVLLNTIVLHVKMILEEKACCQSFVRFKEPGQILKKK